MTRHMIPVRHPGARDGFTLIELMIVVALIGILSALVAPFLIAAKASANEASAIQSLRTLVSAQTTYANVCGGGGYTTSLPTLVSEQFASPDIDITPKSGYTFELVASASSTPGGNDCTGATTQSGFYFRAEPLAGHSGTRAFATNEVGTIWQDTSGVAPPEPFAAGGTISPLESR